MGHAGEMPPWCWITVVEEDSGGVPVELLLRHEPAAFEDQEALASLRQTVGKSSSTCAGTDKDCVVDRCHSPFDAGEHDQRAYDCQQNLENAG
jgi:hypothetical protein